MSYEGKTIKNIQIDRYQYLDNQARSVLIKLTDGTILYIRSIRGALSIREAKDATHQISALVEPALDSNVISIGANTLGESSV